jgi:hypothetical protein
MENIFESLGVSEECFESVSILIEQYINEVDWGRSHLDRHMKRGIDDLNRRVISREREAERKPLEVQRAEKGLEDAKSEASKAIDASSKANEIRNKALSSYQSARKKWYETRKNNNKYKPYVDTQNRVEPEAKPLARAVANRINWNNAHVKSQEAKEEKEHAINKREEAQKNLTTAQHNSDPHALRRKERLRELINQR